MGAGAVVVGFEGAAAGALRLGRIMGAGCFLKDSMIFLLLFRGGSCSGAFCEGKGCVGSPVVAACAEGASGCGGGGPTGEAPTEDFAASAVVAVAMTVAGADGPDASQLSLRAADGDGRRVGRTVGRAGPEDSAVVVVTGIVVGVAVVVPPSFPPTVATGGSTRGILGTETSPVCDEDPPKTWVVNRLVALPSA